MPINLSLFATAAEECPETADEEGVAGASSGREREELGEPGFGDEPELPPTWSRNGRIFHTTEKCTRLQAIRKNNRESGKPGLREHCLNCKDIVATKRRG